MFVPTVATEVWTLAPEFRALSITAQCQGLRQTAHARHILDEAIGAVQSGLPAWADAHLSAWDDVFRKFGAKPQRTPSSARSLRDRVLKAGSLNPIDPVVDLYNAISLKFAVPVGGENVAAYRGDPRLVVADGTETFDTMKNGEPATENPEKGEVIWRDDLGVTCRRWNWRQGVRTRIDSSSTNVWFILESLPEMPIEALEEAGAELIAGLRKLFDETVVETALLQKEMPAHV